METADDVKRRIQELEHVDSTLSKEGNFLSEVSDNKTDNNPEDNKPKPSIPRSEPEQKEPDKIPTPEPIEPPELPEPPVDEEEDDDEMKAPPEIPTEFITPTKIKEKVKTIMLCHICSLTGSKVIVSLVDGVGNCKRCNTRIDINKKKSGYIHESAVESLLKMEREKIKAEMTENKPAQKHFFTCRNCNIRVIPFQALKCPNCKKEHGEWNDLDTEIQIEEELNKVKSHPPKNKTTDEVRSEIFKELDLRKKAEVELQNDKLKVCNHCGNKILKNRFDVCPDCGEREPLPSEKRLAEERIKKRQAQLKLEKDDEETEKEMLQCFEETLSNKANFSKLCKNIIGLKVGDKL